MRLEQSTLALGLLFLGVLGSAAACGPSSSSPSSDASDSGATLNDGGETSDATIDASTDHEEAGADAGVTGTSAMISGSRIKGTYYETADGMSSLATLHDTQLDADCSWQIAADGEERCLPTNVIFTTYDEGFPFSDSSCSLAVFDDSASTCAPGAGSYVVGNIAACPTRNRIFSVGAKVGTLANIYSVDNVTGHCVASPAPANAVYYAMSEVGQALFVRGVDVSSTDEAGLTQITVAGDDGSISFRTLHDHVNDSDCAFDVGTDGLLHCLPTTDLITTGAFSDSTCTNVSAQINSTTCDTLSYARGTGTGCVPQTSIYAAGRSITQNFAGTPSSCAPAIVSANESFKTTAVIPPTSFVLGTSTLQASSARIQRRTVTAGSTSEFLSAVDLNGFFHDTLRNEDCLRGPAPDGKMRCLPVQTRDSTSIAYVSVPGTSVFSDANCTVPAALGNATPCTVPKYGFAATSDASTCTTSFSGIYPITGPHTGTISLLVGGVCSGAKAVPAGGIAYDIGPAIPASSFDEITESTH